MKTRSWFTMNYMDSRSMEEATIKQMAAIRADGSYLRLRSSSHRRSVWLVGLRQ